MVESYQFTMVLQAETMTHAGRLDADERAARIALTLSDRCRAAARRMRSLVLLGRVARAAVPAPRP
jgi:hypothetical protein